MNDWRAALACPRTKQPLTREGDRYLSADGRAYPVRGDAIRFLEDGDREWLDTPDGAAMDRGYRAPSAAQTALRRIVTSEYHPGKAWREAKARTLAAGRTLIIGSGASRYDNAVHLDLDDFPGVDVVADAHALPFRDESFDGVLCEVVLEHVAEPDQVVAEAFRALRPGGRVFFIVPFLFPYHGHPHDYRRWSREGLRQTFRRFDELEVGIHAGPCSAMVNLLTEWLYALSGLRFPKGYRLIKGGATALLFPLKFLDRFVNRFPEAHRMAATLYVTGRKPTDGS